MTRMNDNDDGLPVFLDKSGKGYSNMGRMMSKSQGAYSASYAWRYGDKLYSVASTFPGKGNVTYQYGGDQKRRSRVSGTDETWYNWDQGWTVVCEEDSASGTGALKRTYLGRNVAHVDGTSPSTGAWKYYTTDHLGTTRGVWNEDKTAYAALENTPYGESYTATGSAQQVTRRYTGHDWDATSQLYFAPYRYYAPSMGRWLSRDPLGMDDGPNVYGYVQSAPIHREDPSGRNVVSDIGEVVNWLGDVVSPCRREGRLRRSFWLHRFPGEEDRNDFMRHCGMSCELARDVGANCATTLGGLNEIFGVYGQDDHEANMAGRNCASTMCGSGNTRSKRKECCSDKFAKGEFL